MTPPFMHPYVPNSAPETKAAMLAATGATSVEDFYRDVPVDLRLARPLDLPEPFLAEQDLVRHLEGILAQNVSTRTRLSFLGAGTYNHYVPAVVDEVINRSEFLTAYAGEPYEDHGRFQALFQYQSLMGELLNLDVVNVPTYDGMQAAATSVAMAGRITGRHEVIVVSDVQPDKLAKVIDFIGSGMKIVQVPTVNGTADVAAVIALIGADTAAVWVETPSYTGALETALRPLADATHGADALLVVGTDPIGLGVVTPPADSGADIVHGDIQSLGLHQWFGGSHGGFIAVRDETRFVMEMPSRLFGLAATDVLGEYGFGDVAYERTSFAAREDGKEWVGTAAALWGIAAGVYLALMGPQGMVELGETLLARTAYASSQLAALPGVSLVDSAVHLREFVIRFDTGGPGERKKSAQEIVDAMRQRNIEPGVVIGTHDLLVCVTEMTTQSDIDRLVDNLSAVISAGSVLSFGTALKEEMA